MSVAHQFILEDIGIRFTNRKALVSPLSPNRGFLSQIHAPGQTGCSDSTQIKTYPRLIQQTNDAVQIASSSDLSVAVSPLGTVVAPSQPSRDPSLSNPSRTRRKFQRWRVRSSILCCIASNVSPQDNDAKIHMATFGEKEDHICQRIVY